MSVLAAKPNCNWKVRVQLGRRERGAHELFAGSNRAQGCWSVCPVLRPSQAAPLLSPSVGQGLGEDAGGWSSGVLVLSSVGDLSRDLQRRWDMVLFQLLCLL